MGWCSPSMERYTADAKPCPSKAQGGSDGVHCYASHLPDSGFYTEWLDGARLPVLVSAHCSTKNGNRGGSGRLDCRNSNQSDVICGILDPADDISGICEISVWISSKSRVIRDSPRTGHHRFRQFHQRNFGFVNFINRFILNLPILQSNQCQK